MPQPDSKLMTGRSSKKESGSAIGRVYPPARNGVAAASLLVVVVVVVVFRLLRFGSATVDPVPERTDVQEVCRIDGKWLTPHGPGNHPLAEAAARFALLGDASQTHWVLDSTDCTLRELTLPPAKSTERIEAVTLTDVAVLFAATGEADLPVELIRVDFVTGELKRSPLPQRGEEGVHLQFSRDGTRAVWITGFGTDHERVHGAPVGQMQPEFSFAPGARLGLGPHYLVDVGRSGREVLLQQSRGEYLLVDGSGSLIRTLRSDDSIRPFGATIRFAADGDAYVAWQNYSEQLRSVVQWRVAARVVRKDLPDESTVVSAAASSDWTWIAASIQANTKSGRGVESLTVWSADGTVRFHKRLRDGARTPVVFLAGDLVAYNEVDAKWQGATRVVRLTRTATTSSSQ
jgi:hypothetical protein